MNEKYVMKNTMVIPVFLHWFASIVTSYAKDAPKISQEMAIITINVPFAMNIQSKMKEYLSKNCLHLKV